MDSRGYAVDSRYRDDFWSYSADVFKTRNVLDIAFVFLHIKRKKRVFEPVLKKWLRDFEKYPSLADNEYEYVRSYFVHVPVKQKITAKKNQTKYRKLKSDVKMRTVLFRLPEKAHW